jgi:hypothetical protein
VTRELVQDYNQRDARSRALLPMHIFSIQRRVEYVSKLLEDSVVSRGLKTGAALGKPLRLVVSLLIAAKPVRVHSINHLGVFLCHYNPPPTQISERSCAGCIVVCCHKPQFWRYH